MYTTIGFDSYYFTTSGFYIMFIAVAVPYTKVYQKATAAGVKLKEASGPILESGKLFGKGWIGVEVEKPTEPRSDVVHMKGDYRVYEHVGPYKSIGQACKKISKDHPGSKMIYNLYLDDPAKVPAEKLRTLILFK